MKPVFSAKLLSKIFIIFISMNFGVFGQNTKPVVTVDSVDLAKYVGRWYEIAKIPNNFQSKCDHNTTADYKLKEDGRIEVINRCVEKDGTVNEADGVAKVSDSKTNSKLEVSFVRILGIQLFWGDYWIIGLAKDYRYAVVGTPSRKYGWILCRQPKMKEEDLNEAFGILRKNGYDPSKFEMTVQKWKATKM